MHHYLSLYYMKMQEGFNLYLNKIGVMGKMDSVMVDINEKFRKMIEEKRRRAECLLAEREKHARLMESFMNVHQLARTGRVDSFVRDFYEKKAQELGPGKVEYLKNQAAAYIQILESNGKIYDHISWFKFVMNYGR